MIRHSIAPLVLFVAACSSSTEPEGPPAGGSGPGAAGSASAGSDGGSVAGSAGQAAGGSSSTAGMSGGGDPAMGGGGSGNAAAGQSGGGNGGTGTGGGSAGSAGAAGSAGSGGGSAGAGGGGSAAAVKPSAGCAKQSATFTIPNSRVSIPPGYDGKTPFPTVIAFHAAGNDNSSMESNFRNSDLAKKYVMIYPNSTSATSSKNGWSIQADKQRYLDVHAAVKSEACVDENRTFATGHSSGAQFVVSLLCSGDADFDAVAPVASSVYCQKWKNGAVPALVIHGVQDEERTKYGLNDGDGKKDLQPYLTSNECSMMSTPFDPDLSACSNVKGVDGKAFNDGCVEFSGCKVKTQWCNHNDPQYGTTNHGIPCFGKRAMFDFFEKF